ncbi:MAG: MFS transporter [Mailhella sp.]|nr:MFS transporter [Mailhella sp.]
MFAKSILFSDSQRRIVFLAVITAVCLMSDSMLYVVLPLHWQETGLTSLWEVGIILSVNRFTRLAANPFAGWLYTRVKIRTCIIAAVIFALCANGGYAFCHGLFSWCVLRAMWGVAWSLLKIGSLAAILELTEVTNRGDMVGMYNGLYRIGSLAGMLCGGFLADLFGFAPTALIFAAPVAPALILTAVVIPNVRARNTNKQAEGRSAFSDLKKAWSLLPFLATALLVNFTLLGVLSSSLGPMVKEHLGESILIFGLVIGCASVTGIFQSLRWIAELFFARRFGRISDGRLGRTRVLALSLTIGSVLFFMAGLPSLTGLAWTAVILMIQITATAMNTATDAVVTDQAALSSHPMIMLAAYAFFSDLGMALAPPIMFWAGSSWGFSPMYMAVALVLGIAAFAWSVRARQHQ